MISPCFEVRNFVLRCEAHSFARENLPTSRTIYLRARRLLENKYTLGGSCLPNKHEGNFHRLNQLQENFAVLKAPSIIYSKHHSPNIVPFVMLDTIRIVICEHLCLQQECRFAASKRRIPYRESSGASGSHDRAPLAFCTHPQWWDLMNISSKLLPAKQNDNTVP
jgi:hypothetical protein